MQKFDGSRLLFNENTKQFILPQTEFLSKKCSAQTHTPAEVHCMLGDAHVNPVRHAPYNWPGRTVGSGDNRPETTNRLVQYFLV